MKTGTLLAWSAAIGIIIAPLGLKLSRAQTDMVTVDWVNDSVSLSTNDWAYDEKRNSTNASGLFWHTKTVVSTNKVNPWFIVAGQGKAEIGFRSDGVVVWRKVE